MSVDELADLIEALEGDEFKRARARQRLLEIGQPALESLLKVVQAGQGRKAWIATDLLGEIQGRQALPVLIAALRSPNATLSSMAVKSLLRFGNLDKVPILVEALSHAHLMTQQTIVLALQRLGDRRAVEPLIEYLNQVESSTLRCGVIQTLGRLGDERAIPAIQVWVDDSDHHVREWAATALEHLGHKSPSDS